VVREERVVVSGREIHRREEETETIGTIINQDGLTVLSLFMADPAAFSDILLKEKEDIKLKWESRIVDVKMLFEDGRELEAEVILRDKDLDLLFIHPLKRSKTPIFAVNLSQSSKPKIMEEILILSRLGSGMNRVPCAWPSWIQAIVKKPRKLYIPVLRGLQDRLGAPVFTLDGRIVGVLLAKVSRPKRDGMWEISIFAGAGEAEITPVILPAKDVLEIAEEIPKK
jgi:hypothetical protein